MRSGDVLPSSRTYEVMLVGFGLEVLLGPLNEHDNVRECSNGVLCEREGECGREGEQGHWTLSILTNEVWQWCQAQIDEV